MHEVRYKNLNAFDIQCRNVLRKAAGNFLLYQNDGMGHYPNFPGLLMGILCVVR
jgi:hypothetical protein